MAAKIKEGMTGGQVADIIEQNFENLENKFQQLSDQFDHTKEDINRTLDEYQTQVDDAYGSIALQVDEEDTTNEKGKIKLKDRAYEPDKFSGKGYKILRKNIICNTETGESKNILTQDMINEPNTRYVIQYDFDLNEQEIAIPKDCILEFQGGSLNNGKIIFNKTKVYGNWFNRINNIKFNYLFTNDDNSYISVDLFGADNTGNIDSINAIQNAIDYCTYNKLYIPINFNGIYLISEHIVCNSNTYLKGNNSEIIWDNINEGAYKSDNIITNYSWKNNLKENNNIDSNITIDSFIINLEGNTLYYGEESNTESDISSIPRGVLAFRNVDNLIINNFKRIYNCKLQPIWLVDCSNVEIHYCYIERKDSEERDTSGIWCYAFKRQLKNYNIHHNTIIARQDECINFSTYIKYNANTKIENINISYNTLISYRSFTISTNCQYENSIINLNINNNNLYGGPIGIRNGTNNINIYNNYYSNEEIVSTVDKFNGFVYIDSNYGSSFISNNINIYNNTVDIYNNGKFIPYLNLSRSIICCNNIINYNVINSKDNITDLIYIHYEVHKFVFKNNIIYSDTDYYNLISTIGNKTLEITNNTFKCYNLIYLKYLSNDIISINNMTISGNNIYRLKHFIDKDEEILNLNLSTCIINDNIINNTFSDFSIFNVDFTDNIAKNNITIHNNAIAIYQLTKLKGFKGVNYAIYTDNQNLSENTGFVYFNGYITASNTENKPSKPSVGFMFFDTTFKRPVWWDGEKWYYANDIKEEILDNKLTGDIYFDKTLNILKRYNGTIWIPININYGASNKRPINPDIGFQYFDTTLNKPIWWTGTKWVDATGEDV